MSIEITLVIVAEVVGSARRFAYLTKNLLSHTAGP